MDEAKTLVQHFMSALFGVLVLAAVIALITVGNLLWRALSRQDDANRTLKEYAKYSAFDGTIVRGQDVISLIHDTQGDPFIVIVNKDYKPILTAFNGVTDDFDMDNYSFGMDSGSKAVSEACHKSAGASHTVSNFGGADGVAHYCYTEGTDTDNVTYRPDYAVLMDWFLQRGALSQGGVSGYLQYNSYVVYDNDSTATIVGFILVEKEGSVES